jgi:RES domain
MQIPSPARLSPAPKREDDQLLTSAVSRIAAFWGLSNAKLGAVLGLSAAAISPSAAPPTTTTEHLSFSVLVKAVRALDLTKPPFDADAALWCAPDDYSATQELAGQAREAQAQLVRSTSVRDPAVRANVALLDPAVFGAVEPAFHQTWHFRFEQGRLSAIAAFPGGGAYRF